MNMFMSDNGYAVYAVFGSEEIEMLFLNSRLLAFFVRFRT